MSAHGSQSRSSDGQQQHNNERAAPGAAIATAADSGVIALQLREMGEEVFGKESFDKVLGERLIKRRRRKGAEAPMEEEDMSPESKKARTIVEEFTHGSPPWSSSLAGSHSSCSSTDNSISTNSTSGAAAIINRHFLGGKQEKMKRLHLLKADEVLRRTLLHVLQAKSPSAAACAIVVQFDATDLRGVGSYSEAKLLNSKRRMTNKHRVSLIAGECVLLERLEGSLRANGFFAGASRLDIADAANVVQRGILDGNFEDGDRAAICVGREVDGDLSSRMEFSSSADNSGERSLQLQASGSAACRADSVLFESDRQHKSGCAFSSPVKRLSFGSDDSGQSQQPPGLQQGDRGGRDEDDLTPGFSFTIGERVALERMRRSFYGVGCTSVGEVRSSIVDRSEKSTRGLGAVRHQPAKLRRVPLNFRLTSDTEPKDSEKESFVHGYHLMAEAVRWLPKPSETLSVLIVSSDGAAAPLAAQDRAEDIFHKITDNQTTDKLSCTGRAVIFMQCNAHWSQNVAKAGAEVCLDVLGSTTSELCSSQKRQAGLLSRNRVLLAKRIKPSPSDFLPNEIYRQSGIVLRDTFAGAGHKKWGRRDLGQHRLKSFCDLFGQEGHDDQESGPLNLDPEVGKVTSNSSVSNLHPKVGKVTSSSSSTSNLGQEVGKVTSSSSRGRDSSYVAQGAATPGAGGVIPLASIPEDVAVAHPAPPTPLGSSTDGPGGGRSRAKLPQQGGAGRAAAAAAAAADCLAESAAERLAEIQSMFVGFGAPSLTRWGSTGRAALNLCCTIPCSLYRFEGEHVKGNQYYRRFHSMRSSYNVNLALSVIMHPSDTIEHIYRRSDVSSYVQAANLPSVLHSTTAKSFAAMCKLVPIEDPYKLKLNPKRHRGAAAAAASANSVSSRAAATSSGSALGAKISGLQVPAPAPQPGGADLPQGDGPASGPGPMPLREAKSKRGRSSAAASAKIEGHMTVEPDRGMFDGGTGTAAAAAATGGEKATPEKAVLSASLGCEGRSSFSNPVNFAGLLAQPNNNADGDGRTENQTEAARESLSQGPELFRFRLSCCLGLLAFWGGYHYQSEFREESEDIAFLNAFEKVGSLAQKQTQSSRPSAACAKLNAAQRQSLPTVTVTGQWHASDLSLQAVSNAAAVTCKARLSLDLKPRSPAKRAAVTCRV